MATRLLHDATSMINVRETELGDQEALSDAVNLLPDEFSDIDDGNCQEVLLSLHYTLQIKCSRLYSFMFVIRLWAVRCSLGFDIETKLKLTM